MRRGKTLASLKFLIILGAFFVWAQAFAAVEISEVAWMGSSPLPGETTNSAANREWIELRNTGSSALDLSGWILVAADGTPNISLSDKCTNITIPATGFLLLERTSDDSVPGIPADCIYTVALGNSGEILILKDSSGNEVDRVDGSNDWAIGGSNETKETLQKTSSGWKTLAVTPKAAPPQISASSGSQTPSASGGSVFPPPETKIKSEIISPDSGIAGAEILFEAVVYGISGEPMKAESYLWSFGDGAYARSAKTNHAYPFPGKYLVALNVRSSEFSASSYKEIEIFENKLSISEAKGGENSWIKLLNSSAVRLNLSGWILRHIGKTFIFPEETYILPKAVLTIAEGVSGLKLALAGEVEFLYPNGTLAQKFSYPSAPPVSSTPMSRPSGVGVSAISTSSPVSTSSFSESQPAQATVPFFSNSIYSWGLIALGVGLLAALGYLASQRLQ